MKKIIIALVALITLAINVNADNYAEASQVVKNDVSNVNVPNFNRMCAYLEASSDQIKPLRQSMQQFFYHLNIVNMENDKVKAGKTFNNALEAHKIAIKRILDNEQQTKYWTIMKTTLQNYAKEYGY